MDKYCKAVYKIICLEACREQGISDGLGYTKIKKIDILFITLALICFILSVLFQS